MRKTYPAAARYSEVLASSCARCSRQLGLPADMRDVLNHHSISQMEEYFAELERLELNPKVVKATHALYAQ